MPWVRVDYTFKDWVTIPVGYNYQHNWDKMYNKIIKTSNLFVTI